MKHSGIALCRCPTTALLYFLCSALAITSQHFNLTYLYQHRRQAGKIPKQRRQIWIFRIMIISIISSIDHTFFRPAKHWIFVIIVRVGTPGRCHVQPWRHQYKLGRHWSVMFTQPHAECYRKTTSRRITRYKDLISRITHIQNHFIRCNGI